MFCAILVLACPVIVSYDEDTVEESDAVVPAIMLAGAIIVFVATAYITFSLASSLGGGDPPEGSVDDSVNATLRELQAQLVSSNYDTAAGIWSKLAVNDAQLWSFVENYFDNQSETAVASLWSDSSRYDGDRILELSSFVANSLIYNYNVTSTWNEFSISWSDYRDKWANDPAYDTMEVAFTWGSDRWTSDGLFSAELMRYVTPTASSDRVYIDVVGTNEDGWTDRTDMMLCVGSSGSLTSASTGRTFALSEGENDLHSLGVTSGWYELAPSTTYISQNLSGSVSEDGLMPNACMVLRNGSDFAFVYESGGAFSVVHDGLPAITDDIGLEITYDDGDGNRMSGFLVDLSQVLEAYTDISEALNHAALSANYAGETAWNVYDILGQSSALLKPSSITAGTQTDIPLTSEQASVMYIAAMQQISGLGADATSDGILISPDSMTLYLHGDIYYEGVLIADDAVYTPFVFTDSTLSVGRQTLYTNGLAMIWATGVPVLEDWDGVTSGSIIISISGATLDTDRIVRDGVEVSSVDLKVDSMERLGLIGFNVPDPPPTPTTIDVTLLMQIILLLAGAMLTVIGLLVRAPWMAVFGMIVAVAGYYLAGWIAGMIWG